LNLNGKGKTIMAKKISTVIQEIIGLQTKNATIPLTWKNTLQEHIKQPTEATNSTKTIQSDNTCKYSERKKKKEKKL
jgi:predicted ATP-binding protein involved in virulence